MFDRKEAFVGLQVLKRSQKLATLQKKYTFRELKPASVENRDDLHQRSAFLYVCGSFHSAVTITALYEEKPDA